LNDSSTRLEDAVEKIKEFTKHTSANNIIVTYAAANSGESISDEFFVVKGTDSLKEKWTENSTVVSGDFTKQLLDCSLMLGNASTTCLESLAFGIPVVTLLDTPGAYPGLEAEERGQGEAIARNILEMTRLKTPIITVVIGEGASGGAVGIGVGDLVYMMENTWYSVILLNLVLLYHLEVFLSNCLAYSYKNHFQWLSILLEEVHYCLTP